MRAQEALKRLLELEFQTVLDVGAGGDHARVFREYGRSVTTINLYDADYVGDYLTSDLGTFDCVWASHVLEHNPNPGLFLKKCFSDLNDDGILAVTVPPLKHEIVGGHVTLWNAGILIYQIILSGNDCSQAMVRTHGYNVSVIVRKRPIELPGLKMDYGDIDTLSEYFPFPAEHGFDGRIEGCNW